MFISWCVAVMWFLVSRAFGNLVFPLGLHFIMMLGLCKRLLHVLNLCQSDTERFDLRWIYRKKNGQYSACSRKTNLFHFSAYSAFACSWCFYHNNMQSSFANTKLCAGRVRRCCWISNIFPDPCRHTGTCFSSESTRKFYISLWMAFEFEFI